eukprot:scaffold44040_cov69-Phaeocystis_antarctica.AAC.8
MRPSSSSLSKRARSASSSSIQLCTVTSSANIASSICNSSSCARRHAATTCSARRPRTPAPAPAPSPSPSAAAAACISRCISRASETMRALAASGAKTQLPPPPPSPAVEPASTSVGLSATRCASSAREAAARARSMSALVHAALVSTCLISLPVFSSRPLASHCGGEGWVVSRVSGERWTVGGLPLRHELTIAVLSHASDLRHELAVRGALHGLRLLLDGLGRRLARARRVRAAAAAHPLHVARRR